MISKDNTTKGSTAGTKKVEGGMTWCQQCCGPIQMVRCWHYSFIEEDPKDFLKNEMIDGREQLLYDFHQTLLYLMNEVEHCETEGTLVSQSKYFHYADKMLEEAWEWGPGEAIQASPEAIFAREERRKMVPK